MGGLPSRHGPHGRGRSPARGPGRLPRPRKTWLAISALSLLLAALAGCGGGEDSDASSAAEPEPQATASPTLLDDRWPLTGLPADGPAPEHPVLVVKVDNTASGAPQHGLGAADMVVEEMVEGGVTRLAAFYHSEVPDLVGPVRSTRATDIGIVEPANAVLVASGGAPVTVRRIEQAGIEVRVEGDTGFSRDTGRSAPYNLYVNLAELAGTVPFLEVPGPYLAWASEGEELPEGQPAGAFAATFSPSHTTRWSFRRDGYVNEDSLAANGDVFRPDTVLVLRVRVGDAGYRDPAGFPVPETELTGDGEALVFHDGSFVRGTWHKDGLEAPLELATDAGEELVLPPGRTWVELVPADGGSVTVER